MKTSISLISLHLFICLFNTINLLLFWKYNFLPEWIKTPVCHTNQNPTIKMFLDYPKAYEVNNIGVTELVQDYSNYDIRYSTLAYNYLPRYYLVCSKYLLTLIDDQGNLLQSIGDSSDPSDVIPYQQSTMCSFCKSSNPNEYLISFVMGGNLQLAIVTSDLVATTPIEKKQVIEVDASTGYLYDFHDCIEIQSTSINYFCLYAYNVTVNPLEQKMTGVYYSEAYTKLKTLPINQPYEMIKRVDDNKIKKQEYYIYYDQKISKLRIEGDSATNVVFHDFSTELNTFCVTSLSKDDDIIIAVTMTDKRQYYILIINHKIPKLFISTVSYTMDMPRENLSLRNFSNDFSRQFYFYSLLESRENAIYDIQLPICLSSSFIMKVVPGDLFSMSAFNYRKLYINEPEFSLLQGREVDNIVLGQYYQLNTLSFKTTKVRYFKWLYVIRVQGDRGDYNQVDLPLTGDGGYSGVCELEFNVCYSSCANCTAYGNDYDNLCTECKKHYHRDPLNTNICRFECPPECAHCAEIEKYTYVCDACRYKVKAVNGTDPDTGITELECYTLDEMKNQFQTIEEIKDKVDELYQLYPSTINIDNGTVEIIDSSSTNQGQSNTSRIHLGECETLLRDKYSIPIGENMIIVKIDTVEEPRITNKVTYHVYRMNGTKLNISICDYNPIEVKSPIHNMTPELKEKLKQFEELGIDLYNKSDPFFNDRCTPFTSTEGTDIPLRDRRDNLALDSSSLCSAECSYNGINLIDNTVICNCYSNGEVAESSPSSTGNKFENLLGSFLGVLKEANFDVATCYKLVFNTTVMKLNIGSWFVLCIVVLCLIIIIVFMCSLMGKLYFIYYTTAVELSKRQAASAKTKPHPPTRTRNKPSKLSMNTLSEVKSLQSNQYVDKHSHEVLPSINDVANSRDSYTIEELNEMEYDEAIIDDTRNYPNMYLGFILMTQPILATFFYHSKLNLRSIKISMFLFSFVIDFALSAFFYSDEYISKKYQNGGENDFINSLPVSLYTYAFSMIISLIFNFLSNPPSMEKLAKITDGDEMLRRVKKYVICYKVKLTFYFILQILFLAMFWYYASSFCGVYQNSQMNWLISGFISVGLNMALPFAFSIVLSLLRFISIRCRLKWMFCVITIVMIIIDFV